MSVVDSVVLKFVPTGRGLSHSVGLMPYAGNPESASLLQSVAEAMLGRWAGTLPLLLVHDEFGMLRVIFACSDDINPVVTLRLHLLWIKYGWGVLVFAMCDNLVYDPATWAPYLGEPWGDIDPALASWLQREMDRHLDSRGDRTDEDQWKTPIPFGGTMGLFTGDEADPRIE